MIVNRQTISETDLYPPVKEYLTGLGYEVKGEVSGCDIAARLGHDLVAVELVCHPEARQNRTDTRRRKVILRDNHYGWFDRFSRGLYRFQAAGKNALRDSGACLFAAGRDHCPGLRRTRGGGCRNDRRRGVRGFDAPDRR